MEPDQEALAAEAQALEARQALVAAVLPSVVSVEWTWMIGSDTVVAVTAGSVLHKSVDHTYILTSRPLGSIGGGDINALVRFHDQVERNAKLLTVGDDEDNNILGFTVLRAPGIHESSVSIQFNEEPIDFSSALCVVPKTKSDLHKIQGFIPRPTCAANTMAHIVPQQTNDCFVFVCQHRDTDIMKSTPVFHENSRVNGFVIQDCSYTEADAKDKPEESEDEDFDENSDDDGEPEGKEFIDKEAKICVKQRRVEEWLRQVTGANNWRAGLDDL